MKVEAKKGGGKVGNRWPGNGATSAAKRAGPVKFSKGMAKEGHNMFRAKLQGGGK